MLFSLNLVFDFFWKFVSFKFHHRDVYLVLLIWRPSGVKAAANSRAVCFPTCFPQLSLCSASSVFHLPWQRISCCISPCLMGVIDCPSKGESFYSQNMVRCRSGTLRLITISKQFACLPCIFSFLLWDFCWQKLTKGWTVACSWQTKLFTLWVQSGSLPSEVKYWLGTLTSDLEQATGLWTEEPSTSSPKQTNE